MPRYIEVDLLKLGINKNDEIFCTPVRPLIIDLIDNMPTADVEPVRHGKWIEKPTIAYCSKCHVHWTKSFIISLRKTYKFCPNCGAKMDLKEGE